MHARLGQPDAALRLFEKARPIRERLAAANPSVPQFQTEYGIIFLDLGRILWLLGRKEEAIGHREKGCDLLQRVVSANPAVLDYQRWLIYGLFGLGSMRLEVGRIDAAIKAYQKGQDLRESVHRRNPSWASIHTPLAEGLSGLAQAQTRAGRTAVALRHLERARAIDEGLAAASATSRYGVACDLALCIPLVSRGEERRRYGDEAMEALDQAIRQGYRDVAHMAKDKDLEALRSRSDFQLLMMDLAMPADPFARAD
jgi:tetratricopeptide (TPR) repeat protein